MDVIIIVKDKPFWLACPFTWGNVSWLEASLNLFYKEHNMSEDPSKEKWVGFSLGYLTGRNGDFFEKNTFKLGFVKRINNVISINPEL